MDKVTQLKMCRGCYCDFYNHGTNECWHLDSAKLVKRTRVGTWQNPPYKWAPVETLSCHNPQGSSWIDRDDPRLTETEGANDANDSNEE